MNEKNSYEGHRQRLKDRFLSSGFQAFAPHEKLEFLLTFALPRRDCKKIAKLLLQNFKNFSGVLDADLNELIKIDGIGLHAALLIKSIKGFCEAYLEENIKEKQKITSLEDILHLLKIKLEGLKDEAVFAVYLDTKNNFLNIEKISSGTIDEAPMYLRKIVELAIKNNAKSVILVHNHPSGEPTPSRADKEITLKIKDGLLLLDIYLLDHVIIGQKNHYSFKANKIL